MITNIHEYYTKLSYEVTPQIPMCVCPIHELNNKVPIHYGSGVLLKIADSHFLATASHNLEELKYLYFPIPPDMHYPLGGKSYRIFGPSSIYQDDKIDIAVIKLNDQTVEHLNTHYSF